MRRLAATALMLLLLASAGITTLAQGFDEPGYENAISVILCDCGCHPQSVKDCACGHAAGMRDEIRQEMSIDPPMTAQQLITWQEIKVF